PTPRTQSLSLFPISSPTLSSDPIFPHGVRRAPRSDKVYAGRRRRPALPDAGELRAGRRWTPESSEPAAAGRRRCLAPPATKETCAGRRRYPVLPPPESPAPAADEVLH
ncbi:unnamed protein product, partial [Urochloa humidicola]